jgi:hypothetical protein
VPNDDATISRVNRSLLSVAAVALTLNLAACGSSAPLTARQLAAKIPGCTGTFANTPAVMEEQDVTCTLVDGAPVDIGTFATAGDERQWISDGGSPASPDPAYAGCCIQGDGWAATVGFNSSLGPMDVDYRQVIKALGGRMVTG